MVLEYLPTKMGHSLGKCLPTYSSTMEHMGYIYMVYIANIVVVKLLTCYDYSKIIVIPLMYSNVVVKLLLLIYYYYY